MLEETDITQKTLTVNVFCPKCGSLSFPSPSGDIACTNHECHYIGPATLVVKGADGKPVDLSKVTSSQQAEKQKRVNRDQGRVDPAWDEPGIRIQPTVPLCPKCDSKMKAAGTGGLECPSCGHLMF